MSLDSSQSDQQKMVSVRRFRRADGAVMPFLPYGLIPVAGLAALLLFGWFVLAFTTIQGSARAASERALAEAGESWARVRASGQWITIEGTPPTPEAGERALAVVKTAATSTWLGKARPVTRVRAGFATTAPAQANSIKASTTSPPDPEFLFRLTAGTLSLNGNIPTQSLKTDLEDLAESRKSPDHLIDVINALNVTGGALPNGFEAVAQRGIDTLSECVSGTASFSDLTFNLRCQADDTKVESIRASANAGLPLGVFGTIEILPIQAVASCEEELSRLLEAARIEFAPGSVILNVASGPVLDLAARAASDCPGTLRVEGHTDDTGNPGYNDQLSLRRAEAVRAAMIERGVPPDRLVAAGYGQNNPVSSNETEDGRARNRRIEIRIIRPGE
ncbi:OmpA family protein [Hyphomonas hirschiana VP5]|nr:MULTISPECIES: OmpA family protein [Hyphomonas]KCZ95062.1 OmpA family protein [Hyphomonas hirschiana VP5]